MTIEERLTQLRDQIVEKIGREPAKSIKDEVMAIYKLGLEYGAAMGVEAAISGEVEVEVLPVVKA